MTNQQDPQHVPIRVYQTDSQFMVAAPMPGLEPQNINVRIDGARVVIQGSERGPHQHERDLLFTEWTIGPYYREVMLPGPVNGRLSNATYGNGVLVLSMPKVPVESPEHAVEFRLAAIEPTRGEHIGHTGHHHQESSTEEHRQRVSEVVQRAHGAAPARSAP